MDTVSGDNVAAGDVAQGSVDVRSSGVWCHICTVLEL